MQLKLKITDKEFIVHSELDDPFVYEILKSDLIRKVFQYYEDKIEIIP
jgi:hypothetical protein